MQKLIKWIPIFFGVFISVSCLMAQKGYDIKVRLSNYDQEKLVLGFQLGDKSYIKDSAMVQKDGWFQFKSDSASLDPGVYIILMKPDNQYFQVLIDNNAQRFSFEVDAKEPLKSLKVKGANTNNDFYDYLRYLDGQRVEAESLKKSIDPKSDPTAQKKAEAGLEKINKNVRKYQDELCDKNPGSLMAALIKGSQDVVVPEYPELSDSLNKVKRYYYFKDHYFDNIDLTNKKLLKTNVLFQKVDYYVQKLCVQHPDTVTAGVERILNKMRPNEDIFKFYLIHFLNFYAKSNVVGFDAIYVKIVEDYYANGLAPWTEKDQLDKILKEARQLKPILIGKQAPNIKMLKQDNSPISLYDVKSDFIILLFWNPDCGHCKKEMPTVVALEKKLKSKGVTVFSICTALRDKVGECWDFVKDKQMDDFLNVMDPDVTSGYYSLYKVQQTPMTFILDANKKIISKRISPEQLEEVMDHFIMEKEKGIK